MASQPPKVNTKGGKGSKAQTRKPSGDGKLAPGAKLGLKGNTDKNSARSGRGSR